MQILRRSTMLFTVLAALTLSANCMAANQGRITGIHFAGQSYVPHPNVVQMTLEGGFGEGTCNTGLAAIRAADKHLVSLALAAYAAGFPVHVSLDQSDRYFDNRCVINYIWVQE
jgi:hypothetical protein